MQQVKKHEQIFIDSVERIVEDFETLQAGGSQELQPALRALAELESFIADPKKLGDLQSSVIAGEALERFACEPKRPGEYVKILDYTDAAFDEVELDVMRKAACKLAFLLRELGISFELRDYSISITAEYAFDLVPSDAFPPVYQEMGMRPTSYRRGGERLSPGADTARMLFVFARRSVDDA